MAEAQSVTVSVLDNGPYMVVGPITLTDDNGAPLTVEAGEKVFLCRCGASADKPFCDGAHHDVGFQHCAIAAK